MAESGFRRFVRIALQMIARGAGLLSILFIVQNWRMVGLPPLGTLSMFLLMSVLALAAIGFLMGWASDGLGGFVLLVLGGCSAAVIYSGVEAGLGSEWALVYAAPIVGTGVLHLVAWASKGQSTYRLPRPGGSPSPTGRPPAGTRAASANAPPRRTSPPPTTPATSTTPTAPTRTSEPSGTISYEEPMEDAEPRERRGSSVRARAPPPASRSEAARRDRERRPQAD